MNYNDILNSHLYSFVKEVLQKVANEGFCDGHHLLITFSTKHHNVSISSYLREVYKEELTILLDSEFYGLSCDNDGFSVKLTFDESGDETIYVPYSSIIAIEDPFCDFVLDMVPDLSNIKVDDLNNVISFKDLQR